jgi:hypothetical protein
MVLELVRCEFFARWENVLLLGNSGTGKTHIALALGASCLPAGRQSPPELSHVDSASGVQGYRLTFSGHSLHLPCTPVIAAFRQMSLPTPMPPA